MYHQLGIIEQITVKYDVGPEADEDWDDDSSSQLLHTLCLLREVLSSVEGELPLRNAVSCSSCVSRSKESSSETKVSASIELLS